MTVISDFAIGITPERALEILELPLVGSTASIESGVSVITQGGDSRQIVGEIATKAIARMGSFDVPVFDFVVPEWMYPFSSLPSKLSNPVTQPASNARELAWSPDGVYLAVAHTSSPNLTVYKRSGDTLTKLADPATLPANTCYSCCWSPDGLYLVVTYNTTPCSTVYKRNGDVFTKLIDLASSGGNTVWSCSFSSDGTYLALGGNALTIYKKTAVDTFTKLTDPAAPAGMTNDVAWSPNGAYVASAHATTPYLTVYKRTGDSFAKLANPVSLPPGDSLGMDWSVDGVYLALAHSVAPYLTVYKCSGDVLAKLDNPPVLPVGSAIDVSWYLGAKYLAMALTVAPYHCIYKRIGDTFQKLPDLPTSLYITQPQCTSFSPDGQILGFGGYHPTAPPYTAFYKYSGGEVYGGVPIRI